jgi:O-antigen/teichoic acid export membrane protein
VFSFFIIPKWGVSGYVFALILANILAAVYSAVFSGVFKYLAIKAVKKSACAEMLKYSVPLIPNSMLGIVIVMINRPLMERFLGMYEVGIFAVANKIPGLLSMIFSIFAMAWPISVLEEFGKKEYTNFYNKIFRLVITVLTFFFIIITISSRLIISIFATSDFYEAWRYVPILTIGMIFLNISMFAGSNFLAIRKSKYFLYSSIWGATSSIILNFVLIQKYGIIGSAISVSISYMIIAIARILYGWKYIKIQNIHIYLIMFLLSVLIIIVVLFIQTALLKYILIAFLFILFICINYKLKDDFLNVYKKFKAKL